MNSIERNTTFDDVLAEAAESAARVRIYGRSMAIIAEGLVAFVGNNVVGIKHKKKESATEFIRKDHIVKIQMLGEQEVLC